MTAPLLLALLISQAAPGSAPDPGRSVTRHALAAVEGDSVESVRRRWSARLDRDPSDRLARLGLATLARLRYEEERALELYEGLFRDAPGGPDLLTQEARVGLAATHVAAGRMAEADSALTRALGGLDGREGGARLEAQVLLLLAMIRERSLGADTALALFARGERRAPADEGGLAARLLCRRARALLRAVGPDVTELLAEGLLLAREAGSRRDEADCLMVAAQRHEQLGLMDSARVALESVESLQRATRDEAGLAMTTWWRGNIALTLGEYGLARRLLLESVEAGTASRQASTVAWAYLLLTHLADRLGDAPAAVAYAEIAGGKLREQQDLAGLSSVLFLQGNQRLSLGDLDGAESAYQESVRLSEQIGNLPLLPFLGRGLAWVARERGRFTDAEAHLHVADSVARLVGQWQDAGEVELLYDRGMLDLARGRPDEAAAWFRAYLSRLRFAIYGARFEARARLAEALSLTGDLDGAEAELLEAHRRLDAWRQSLDDRGLRIAILEARRLDHDSGLGVATVVARLVEAGRVESGFHLAEQRRARDLLDRVARRSAIAEGAASPGEAGPLPSVTPKADLDAIRATLGDDAALLAYVTGRRGEPTTAFVLTRDGLRGHVLVPADSAAEEIARWEALLMAGADPEGPGRRLSESFLAPALKGLPRDVARLVVVPDGPLHRLAFDALFLPDGRRVVERFAVSLAPSAEMAVRLARPRARQAGGAVVAFGDPATPPREAALASVAPPLPRLSASRSEVRRVVRYGRPGRLLVGGAASEAALKSLSHEPVSVLHFAGHALAEERSFLQSALVLAPGDGEDGWVRVEELAGLDLSVDLVILSACRTLGSVVLAGEGIQGLAGPLLEAGARAVAATYWPVGDRASRRLVEGFYGQMATGLPAAEALRQAKLALLREGRPPSEWAAMALVGDASVRPDLADPGGRVRWWALLAIGALVLSALWVLRRTAPRLTRPARPRPSP